MGLSESDRASETGAGNRGSERRAVSRETFHILLVEDEESHAMLIQRAFERSDILESRLTLVGSLAAARQVLAQLPPPGLAIVDAHLPDGRGIDLLTADAPCPVVIMTSQEHKRTAEEARELGALDYVVKSPRIFRELPGMAQRLMESQDSVSRD